jgi:hypothetical protein
MGFQYTHMVDIGVVMLLERLSCAASMVLK